jgi:hypothetical protein
MLMSVALEFAATCLNLMACENRFDVMMIHCHDGF